MPFSSHRLPSASPFAHRPRPTALRRWAPLLVALLVLALVAQAMSSCGGGPPDAGDIEEVAGAVPHRVYWAGESFAGLPLAAINRDGGYVTFVYGDCRPDRDEGCSPPLTIQTVSVCELNPVDFEEVPRRSTPLSTKWRHIVVREYVRGRRMVNIGASTVILGGRGPLTQRVLTALRPVGEPAGTRPLRARYPRELVAEVREAADAYRRLGSIGRVRDELRISKTAIRFRLALAKELGSQRLQRASRGFVHMSGDIPVMGAQIHFTSSCEVEVS